MKIDSLSFSPGSSLPSMALSMALPAPASSAQASASVGVPGFLQVFEGAVMSVDTRTQAASERMRAVELGHSDDLVGAMLASQEASLSFSMLMQVRNKVMGAVDEIVKLQV